MEEEVAGVRPASPAESSAVGPGPWPSILLEPEPETAAEAAGGGRGGSASSGGGEGRNVAVVRPAPLSAPLATQRSRSKVLPGRMAEEAVTPRSDGGGAGAALDSPQSGDGWGAAGALDNLDLEPTEAELAAYCWHTLGHELDEHAALRGLAREGLQAELPSVSAAAFPRRTCPFLCRPAAWPHDKRALPSRAGRRSSTRARTACTLWSWRPARRSGTTRSTRPSSAGPGSSSRRRCGPRRRSGTPAPLSAS